MLYNVYYIYDIYDFICWGKMKTNHITNYCKHTMMKTIELLNDFIQEYQ